MPAYSRIAIRLNVSLRRPQGPQQGRTATGPRVAPETVQSRFMGQISGHSRD
jgi:hypothetical protein